MLLNTYSEYYKINGTRKSEKIKNIKTINIKKQESSLAITPSALAKLRTREDGAG